MKAQIPPGVIIRPALIAFLVALPNLVGARAYFQWHSQHDYDLQYELPAYAEELRQGDAVGMSADDKNAIQVTIDRIKSGGIAGDGGN